MVAGYPTVTLTNDDSTAANVTARVPRPPSGDDSSLTVITLVVEPGHTSSEHFQPGPVSAATRYTATPPALIIIANTAFFIVAALFSQR